MMAGKKGKKVKKPAKTGRPTKYKPEYCKAIIDYFDIPMFGADGKPNTPPYLMNFAQCIGINTDTLYEWKAKHPEFSEAYMVAQEKQKQIVMNHALTGGYNASFAWRMMMNLFGWRDQQDVKVGMDAETLNTLLSALPEQERNAVKTALLKHAK